MTIIVQILALMILVNKPILEVQPQMIVVKEGTFLMEYRALESEETIARQVTLSSYAISQHEVTVKEYRAFYVATGEAMPA